MSTAGNEGAKSRYRVVLEIALLVLVPAVGFGLAISLIAGTEHFVGGAVIGAVFGWILARLRREVYGATGR